MILPAFSTLAVTVDFTDDTNFEHFSVGTSVNGGVVADIDAANSQLTFRWHFTTGTTVSIGGYGSSGFHLDFADNSFTANLGLDVSGNGNDWTPVNLSVAPLNEGPFTAANAYTGTPSNSYGAVDGSWNAAFDGGTANGVTVINASGETHLTMVNSATWSSSIRIRRGYQAGNVDGWVKLNDQELGGGSSSSVWVDVTSTMGSSGTLTNVGIKDNARLFAIELDGEILNDSATAANTDSLIDSPTNYEPESGGNNGGNYCTMNSLPTTNLSFSNGNLDLTNNGSGWGVGIGTMAAASGKWYYEVTVTGTGIGLGIEPTSETPGSNVRIGEGSLGYGWWTDRNQWYANGSSSGATTLGIVSVGDVLGVALDLDAGTLTFYRNGSTGGIDPFFTGISGTYTPAIGSVLNSGTVSASVNFGQRPFQYAPGQTGGPSADHKAWCSANLDAPIADGSTAFDVVTWTGDHDTSSGTNSSRTIALPGDMNPDLVWIKRRSSSFSHLLNDSVRGFDVNKGLNSNTTDPENSTNSDYTQGFVSGAADGEFTVQSGIVDSYTNKLNETYTAWVWGAATAGRRAYDQSQVWSSGTSTNPSSGSWANVFASSFSTSWADNTDAWVYNASATLNFSPALPTGAIQVYAQLQVRMRLIATFHSQMGQTLIQLAI